MSRSCTGLQLLLGATLCGLPFVHPAFVSAQTSRPDSTGKPPEVLEVRLVGVRKVHASELRSALVTMPSRCKSVLIKPFCLISKSPTVVSHEYLDQDEFRRDVLRLLVFYFRRGYREAKLDTVVQRLSGNKVRITLNITEGLPTVVQTVELRGIDSVLSRRDTSRQIRPRIGSPLNLVALDSSLSRLRLRLWERGYADAVLTLNTAVDDSLRRAAITIDVNPKKLLTIGPVLVQGNNQVSEETIRRSLTFATGDIFRLSQISNSQRALYESGLFRRAVVDTALRERRGVGDSTQRDRRGVVDSTARERRAATDSLLAAWTGPDSVKPLVVRVREAPLRETRTAIGFTTADFGQAEFAFTHNYFMQRPLRLDVGITVGNLLARSLTKNNLFADISDIVPDNDLGRYYAPTYQANLDLRQRWFHSPRNTLGAGLFIHRRTAPGVMVDHGYGVSSTFTRDVAFRAPLSVRYQYEVTGVEAGDVYFCVNYGVCDNSTIDALRGRQHLSPLATTISIDRSDIPFSPTRGVIARLELEHASKYTVSDFRYNRASVDVATYKSIGYRGTVLAAHVRGGLVSPLGSSGHSTDPNDPFGENPQILHPRKRFYAGGSQSVRGFGENQLGPRVLTVSANVLKRNIVSGTDTIACATTPTAACLSGIKDADFQARPLGGTALIEGGIEVRIPFALAWTGALFVDGAIVGSRALGNSTPRIGAIAPGFGVRYKSPVGPIRVDIGIRPQLQRALPVITEVRDSTGVLHLVDLTNGAGCVGVNPVGCRVFPSPLERPRFLTRLTSRLTLHLSLGEAF